MAITRLWQTGWETRSLYEISVPNGVAIGGVPRSGGYAGVIAAGGIESIAQDIPATRQIQSGMAVYAEDWGDTSDAEIIVVHNDAARLLELRTIQASGGLQLIVDGVQKDTHAMGLATLTWYHFGIDCKIDSVAGWVKIYYNGVKILSFVGDTGNLDVNRVRFGTLTDAGGGSAYWHIDDCYINDTSGEVSATPPPILRFFFANPNGNGNYSQFTGSDGDKVNNYLMIDNLTSGGPLGADWVESAVADEIDSYAVPTYTKTAEQTFKAVIPITAIQKFNAGGQIALGTRYAATDLIGADQIPEFGVYRYLWERQIAKPGGGDWDQAAIDGMEILVKSRGTF